MKILIIAFTSLLFHACTGSMAVQTAGEAIFLDSVPGQSPWFSRDNEGNPVLSWVRMHDDGSRELCYTVFRNAIPGPVNAIPAGSKVQPHGENIPKLVFLPGGIIIALWGESSPSSSNKYAGRIMYSQSFDNGSTWTGAIPLVADSLAVDQRYFDVALLPGGTAGIIWLDGRREMKGEGAALYFSQSRQDGGFEKGRRISEPCCPCCRTALYVDDGGSMHAVYRGILRDSVRDMVHIVSHDNGKSFSKPRTIHDDNWVLRGCPHTGPAITGNEEGVHFAWYTGAGSGGSYYSGTYHAQSHSHRDSISSRGSHPQMTSMPDGSLVLAWDESMQTKSGMVRSIGLQKRDSRGNDRGRFFIAGDTSVVGYPVLTARDNRSVLVAYTRNRTGKPYVVSQVARVN